jgi:LPXTG-motif cell wall-anchored protein
MWARRVLIGSGMAVASLIAVPSVAGVAGAVTCTTPVTIASMTTPTTSACSTPPNVSGNDGKVSLPNTGTPGAVVPVSTTTSTSSLPFTGADITELAVVGGGAVLAGGLLIRRRRRNVA